jgi:hypothetical protein
MMLSSVDEGFESNSPIQVHEKMGDQRPQTHYQVIYRSENILVACRIHVS